MVKKSGLNLHCLFFFACYGLCDLDNTQDLTKGNQIEYI